MDARLINAMAERVRGDFPLLGRNMGAHRLVFMDSASTTPKPWRVINAVSHYYASCTANVHRGVHSLGEESTRLYDAARREVAELIGGHEDELVFVRGTTEAINLVAHALELGPDDEVVFPASEHHANWLPWRVRAKPVPMPIDSDGVPRWDTLASLITPKTRLLAIGHVSNVTGAIAPVDRVVETAKKKGIPVLLDAAQSFSHMPIDVRRLGVDFLAASSHKAFGPSGVGILWATKERLAGFPLYQVGGGMVALNEDVDPEEAVGWLDQTREPPVAPCQGGASLDRAATMHGFIPREVPFRFEAGTPNIEGTIGFGAAITWMRAIGMQAIREHDMALATYLIERLHAVPHVRILAADMPVDRRMALATFVVESPEMTQENIARALCERYGVCVSGGYHCAHVLHARTHLAGTVRASPHLFNTTEEIDRLVNGVREIAKG
jgi:cysteine desulfurase/selenocysteine lyase